MTGRQSPQQVCRLVASAALLAVSLLPTLASVPSAMAVTVGTAMTTLAASPVTVSLTSITPTIAVPKAAITITGTVRNAGSVPIASPVARALIGERPLTSRGAVSDWATSTDQEPVEVVARTSLGATLAPGTVATFTLTVPPTAISHRESFAVLPLVIDVVGTTPAVASQDTNLGSLHTFLPSLSAIKAYEPMSIAWLVPLTLDPDPALHGMDSADRTAAWTRTIGPGSRLDRLITATDSTQVTWAIDPAVLGPPHTPLAADAATAPGPTPSASNAPAPGGAANPDPVTAATTALASRLRAAAPRHTLWSLPYADPDLAALLPLASDNRTLGALISHPSTLDAAVGPARTDIAWPADGTLTTEREEQLRQAFASPGLAAAVTSASTRTNRSGYAGDASRRSSGGLPLLVYDEALSRTFTQTSSSASGAVTIQLFLADSMALLGDRPGTPGRSVLVAAPRTFAGDPTVLGSFFAAIAKAPWLTPTTTDQLLTASKAATPEVPGAGGTTTIPSPRTPTPPPAAPPTAPDPLSPGTSPLTSAQLRTISSTMSAIDGIASIRDDAQLFQERWSDALDQLLSVRWRDHPGGPTDIGAATQAAITTVTRGVRVAPSSVNFFADQGVLQITVVNDLAVPVHDVRLTLTPAQPRLRIEQQPGPLRIGANSRTNVKLQVTAIATGLVPIEAVLSTPNGTPLGQNARVDVRVQPTSTWVYWVLGGLASLILVLGTYRSLRRGSTRASRPAEQEVNFDD